MKRTPTLLAAALALCLAAPAWAATPSEMIDGVAAHFAKLPVAGMSIAVMRDGRLVHARGYGLANREARLPARADTVYEIGSITKQFTAAAIVRLAAQGRLGLDDPLATHFPEITNAGGVTVRHLLSHTSGLYSGALDGDATVATDPSTVPARLAAHAVESAPGQRHRYNNNGYLLLGLLVERHGGAPWAEVLAREFFRPLGLESTAACPEKRDPRSARGYVHPTRGDATPTPHPVHHPSASFAAGALCSTAGDLLRWQQALVDGRVVGAAGFAAMGTPASLASGKPGPYGFGLYSDARGGEPHVHHGGAASGFVTQLGYWPADRLGVVVLTNGMYAPAIVERIETAVRDAARGIAFEPIAEAPLDATERSGIVGTYRIGPATVEVYLQGDSVRALPAGQVASRLLHQGGRVFVAEHDPAVRMRFEGPADRARTLHMSRGDMQMPAGTRVGAENASP